MCKKGHPLRGCPFKKIGKYKKIVLSVVKEELVRPVLLERVKSEVECSKEFMEEVARIIMVLKKFPLLIFRVGKGNHKRRNSRY